MNKKILLILAALFINSASAMDDSDESISGDDLDKLAAAIESFELRGGSKTGMLKEFEDSSTEEEESETTSEEERENEEVVGCGVKKPERKILVARRRLPKKEKEENN